MDALAVNAELVDNIYAAALAPDAWGEVLTHCADEFAADGVQVLAYSKDGSSVRSCVCGRVDPAANSDYVAHYHSSDVRIPRALAAQPFVVYDDDAFISAPERRRSPFHNEFLKRYDCEQIVLATAPLTSTHSLFLASARSARRERFSSEERGRILGYLPHLQRALQFHLHALAEAERREGIEALFNVHDIGIVLLGSDHRLVHFNEAARATLSRSELFSVKNGQLTVHGADNGRLFLDGVGRVRALFEREGRRELGAIRLSGPSQGTQMDVLVLPVQLASGVVLTAVYLAGTGLGCAPGAATEVLTSLYRLTVAEGRCAELLTQGVSIQEIAERLAVSQNTVRAHLRSLFAKTGTGRQGELIALFTRNIGVLARLFKK